MACLRRSTDIKSLPSGTRPNYGGIKYGIYPAACEMSGFMAQVIPAMMSPSSYAG